MNEFNRNPQESKGAAEYKTGAREYYGAEEQKAYAESPARNEANAEARTNRPAKAKAKRDMSSLTRVLSAFAVTATVVVAVAASGIISDGGSAEIISAKAGNNSVSYEVEVESGEELNIVLYNDFIRREQSLSQGTNSGEFVDLGPGLSYTLAVMGKNAFGETTIAETTVKTSLSPDPVTVWRQLTYGCTCGVDGYFHFTMDFIDENGYFSDFEASLTDDYGNVSECVFAEDLHADQKIGVTVGAYLYGKRATFRLAYATSAPGAESGRAVYEYEVKI